MAKLGMFEHIKAFLYKTYAKDPGKMLKHTGIIGWAMSSLAQVCAIIINDKIPKEQKMFMIPQEVADATVNILSFFVITNTFTGIAKKGVKCGKILPKNIRDHFNIILNNRIPKKKITANIGNIKFNVEKYLKQLPPQLRKDYRGFKNGIDVIATLVGSIISCNIVTPILRNIYASHRQKQNIAKMNSPHIVSSNCKLAKLNPACQNNVYSYNRSGGLKV